MFIPVIALVLVVASVGEAGGGGDTSAISTSSSASASKSETMKCPEWMASLCRITAILWNFCLIPLLWISGLALSNLGALCNDKFFEVSLTLVSLVVSTVSFYAWAIKLFVVFPLTSMLASSTYLGDNSDPMSCHVLYLITIVPSNQTW